MFFIYYYIVYVSEVSSFKPLLLLHVIYARYVCFLYVCMTE